VQPNGTVDDFYIVGPDTSLAWFHAGAFTALPPAGNFLEPAPGSHRVAVLAQLPIDAIPSAVTVENGATVAAFPTASNQIPCACAVETDPSCACVAHDVVFLPTVAPGGDRVGLVTASNLNGRRTLYANQLSLPVASWF